MSKRDKINLLKAKVTAMQHDLSMLERKRKNNKTEIPQFLKPVNRISHSKPKKLLSQTFRDISFKDSDYFFGRGQSVGQKERHTLRMNTEKRLSPVLREITQNINNSFYVNKSIEEKSESKEKKHEPQMKVSSRRKNSSPFIKGSMGADLVGYSSCTIKDTNKKMFGAKKTDIILNPESNVRKGRKIVKEIERSPDKYLSEHPKSNPNVYVFSDKRTFMPVKRPVGDRNHSHLTNSRSKGQIMPTKEANSLGKTMKCQKRHFNRYINQMYSSLYRHEN